MVEPSEGAQVTSEAIPAVEGWFTVGAQPRLIGARCTTCSTVVFPPRHGRCPNPRCAGDELVETPLSRTGRIWSYTTNHYAPPEPYMSPEPFEPYTVAAVELTEERMVVLGQMPRDVDPATLSVGLEVELTVDTLYRDEDGDHVVWMWRPLGATS